MYFTSNLQLLEAIKEKKHFKFFISNLPEIQWADIIDCINSNIENENTVSTLKNFGIVILDTSSIKKIKNVYQNFSELSPNINCSAHLYVSLTSKAETFGWHKDTSDVIFWQVIGHTLFSVLQQGRVYEYTLTPNDLLYIPAGMKHSTQPLTPRAGISFGIDYATTSKL